MKCHEFCHGEKEKKSCDFHFSLVIITKKLQMKGKTKEYENTYFFASTECTRNTRQIVFVFLPKKKLHSKFDLKSYLVLILL